jgi:hypothetical protein
MMKWLNRPLYGALTLVLVWTVCRLVFLWNTGIPQPRIHDEFSYLLQADIFAHGHLAIPQHPLGRFFESPHILVRPKYASKYPPGQALFLAVGQWLLGSPFYGVLIGNALMLFTFCLMLYAFVSPRWALAVSAIFALVLSPSMYWTDSYFGGSIAASGGALVLLGIGLYREKQAAMAGAIFATGTLLLFWTRPYEGGVFTLVLLVVFARELWRTLRRSVLLIALSVLAIGGAWTGYYNQAITGSPFRLPYLLHDHQYNATPVFWFIPMRPEPTYTHSRLAAQHGTNGWEASVYRGNKPQWRSLGADLIASLQAVRYSIENEAVLTLLNPDARNNPLFRKMAAVSGVFLAALAAALFVLTIPVASTDPIFRKMAIVAGVFLLALSLESFHNLHYTAPVWAALALMNAVWAQRVWNLRIRKLPVGGVLVLLVLMLQILIFPYQALQIFPVTSTKAAGDSTGPPAQDNWNDRRAALIQRLSRLDSPEVVLVRYPSPDWNIGEEWVYNGADIDHQRVVFAHDLGVEQNRALLNYYPDRTALLMTFDAATAQEKIGPYPAAHAQPRPSAFRFRS